MTQPNLPALALLLAAAAASAAPAAPTPAWSQTSNLALSTDYVFRGVSQIASSNALAFSGGSDVAHTSGFAAGLWFSNQNYNSATFQDTLEADIYASYAFKAGSADVTLGVITYNYPGATAYNTTEVNVGVALLGASLKYSHALSDYFGVAGSDGTGYLDLSYSRALGDLSLGLHYGWTYGSGGQSDYEDYKVSLSYPLLGYTASVAYTDANAGLTPAATLGKALDQGLVVFSLSKTF